MTVSLHAIIVDDEPPARDRLRRLLDRVGGVTILAEAPDATAALTLLEEHQPDVLFLDINLPGLDGLRLLQALDDPPAVIFTTAYEHHAVKAFELDAVDYLLKPFSAERLAKALERVRRQLPTSGTGNAATRIAAEDGRSVVYLEPTAIVSACIDEGVVFVTRQEGGTVIYPGTLQQLEEQLAGEHFLRINRQTIVNVRLVESVTPQPDGGLMLAMKGGRREEVSRRRARFLKEALGS